MSEELAGNVTVEGSEPTTQAQPAAQTPDVEAVVNRLVEQQVSQRLANLDTEVERRIQSTLAKRENKAKKQFQEDTRVIERMAQRSGWDEERKREELEAALKAANIAAYGEDEAETPAVPAPAAPQPTTYQPTGAGYVPPQTTDEKADLEKYTKQMYGFDPKEMGWDVTEYVNVRDPNDPKIAEFRDKAIELAATAKAQRKEAQRVRAGVEGIGNPMAVGRGSSPPPVNPTQGINDRETLARIWAEEDFKANP